MPGSGLGCGDAKVSKTWSLYSQEFMAWPGGRTDVYRVTATALSSVIMSHTPSALKALRREQRAGKLAPSMCSGTWVLRDK